jgi:hypothetical protein
MLLAWMHLSPAGNQAARGRGGAVPIIEFPRGLVSEARTSVCRFCLLSLTLCEAVDRVVTLLREDQRRPRRCRTEPTHFLLWLATRNDAGMYSHDREKEHREQVISVLLSVAFDGSSAWMCLWKDPNAIYCCLPFPIPNSEHRSYR